MFDPQIGDTITGTVVYVTLPDDGKAKRKSKIGLDIGQPDWTCHLQWNANVKGEVDLLRVGDSVEGWIIRKHGGTKFLAVGISNFGRFPPKPDTYAEYIDSLTSIKRFLVSFREESKTLPSLDHVATVKGLFSRSVKKDQWDWCFVYRAFKFRDDGHAGRTRDKFVAFSDAYKSYCKGKSAIDGVNDKATVLMEIGLLDLINNALRAFAAEQVPWNALRTPMPMFERSKKDVGSKPLPIPVESVGIAEESDETFVRTEGSKVLAERSNAIHSVLVKAMSDNLATLGYMAYYNGLIDLYCSIGSTSFIFEMKSISPTNETTQIRKAISQLYEYRFLHNMSGARLVVVFNRKPQESWLIDYLIRDRTIMPCWLESDYFVCPVEIKDTMQGVCRSE